jgi:hypothetical protein
VCPLTRFVFSVIFTSAASKKSEVREGRPEPPGWTGKLLGKLEQAGREAETSQNWKIF